MSTNYIDQITDTEGITHDISEGDSTRIFRATCSTAAATAAKVATLDTSDRNFSLTAGVRVAVTFTYGNTSDSKLTLNVNSTGAKEIHVRTSATSSYQYGSNYNTWGNYETVIFTYDGSKWLNSGSGLMIYNAWNLANSKTANIGTITSVTTTAGTHSTISVSSGAVSFNVPTKTSHLTNDSGYITTDSDEKLKIEEVEDSTSTTYTYYPILGRSTTTTGIRQIDTDGFQYYNRNGTASADGIAQLTIGNATASGTAGNKSGSINLYGSTSYAGLIKAGALTAARTYTFPDKSGTVALTSDITGGNYTATSPIDITDDVISHEDSGVTAGTYDGGVVKDTGFYFPSFTVDSMGHITSATDLGGLIPDITTSNATNAYNGGILSPSDWAMSLRSHISYGYTLSAGNTSASYTITQDYNSGYGFQTAFRIADVQAYDATTFEPVLVDWTQDKIQSSGSSITLTVSIASAYTNSIRIFPILTYAVAAM